MSVTIFHSYSNSKNSTTLMSGGLLHKPQINKWNFGVLKNHWSHMPLVLSERSERSPVVLDIKNYENYDS